MKREKERMNRGEERERECVSFTMMRREREGKKVGKVRSSLSMARS